MFAVALWDERARRLVIGRDRLGIKPLYLHRDPNRLVFASEVKSLLEAGVPAHLRAGALDCYLAFRYVPAPDTIFEGIEKLPAGELLIVDESGETRRSFYRPQLRPKHDVGEEEAAAHLAELLEKSVEYRLQSDVPLGVFLSGGLDSGFLVALARGQKEGRLDTFSIGFNRGGPYDETAAAGVVSAALGTTQHDIHMDPAGFLALLPSAVYHMDEPMADPSAVPMMALSRLAREHVTVVLSGEGGDELFAGYPRYFGEAMAARAPWPGAPLRWVAAAGRRRLSRSVRRGIEGIGISPASRRHLFWQEIIPARSRERLLATHDAAPRDYIDPLGVVERIGGELDAGDDLDRLFYFDVRAWLCEDLLLKKDKMGMSASIEARVPYLDQDVVAYALRLPVSMKLHGRRGKMILRRVIERRLPAEILGRPKVGFAVPLASWFRHELSAVLRSRLTDPSSFLADVLDRDAVRAMLSSHARGEDVSLALYSLLVLDLWGRIFIRGETPEELSSRINAEM
jgi:asparagine synthase (glutamine-hydrolysing)